MNVKELIEELKQYPPEAEVLTIAHFKRYPFTLSWGDAVDSEGIGKNEATRVYFYIDDLCTNESQK